MSGRLPSSFRDPSGFVFCRGGELFRQVNERYQPTYVAAKESGLFERLMSSGLLIRHVEVDEAPWDPAGAAKVLRPDRVPFITYPYEWCPGQLREAAEATLEIQLIALEHGFTLKDASAFNIQFVDGRATLIDTLSFDPHVDGDPWVAYGQFCRHFLAPLALARLVDPRLLSLTRVHLDGPPLDLTARLLPWTSRLAWGLGVHLHAHGASQQRHAGSGGSARHVSSRALRGLVESLRAVVVKQSWEPERTAWSDYYGERRSYSEPGMQSKREAVAQALRVVAEAGPVSVVWDLGANTGTYATLAREITGADVLALDSDPAAVEIHWRNRKAGVMPLVNDLVNPSPGLGWSHEERASLLARGPADVSMALALIHHLAIGNNVPMAQVVDFLASTTRRFAVVEWVPRDDPMVEHMLASRTDVFDTYDVDHFRAALTRRFDVVRSYRLSGSDREILLLKVRRSHE